MMDKTCSTCSAPFVFSDENAALLQKFTQTFDGQTFEVPVPHECPKCREQNRMAHRNERALYHRKCDSTGRQIISMYSPDKPYIVYDQTVWWSDEFDPLHYGQEIDFTRPFFEQFKELELKVPKSSINNAKSENCDYTNYSAENKNCYMIVGGLNSEDSFYGYRIFSCRDVCDNYNLLGCEKCYDCLLSTDLYHCQHCTECFNSSNLTLCSNCTGCSNCFGCANLKNKEYYIYNQAFSKEDYFTKVAELMSNLDAVKPDIEALHQSVPHKYATKINCEASSGDQLLNCQNCKECYTLKDCQDCHYVANGNTSKDCMDCNFFDNSELQYYTANHEKNYNVMFSNLAWYCKNIAYCASCFNSEDLFGCVGMKKHQYCILNKQYSKEEYEQLVAKLITHMQETGEWGQYFPPSLSAFGYNETVAHAYKPMAQQDVLNAGWNWHNEEQALSNYMGPEVDITAPISEIPDSICDQILTCGVSGKPYKIIPQELKFYRAMNIKIPNVCPDVRHKNRMDRLNPRTLWNRQCHQCQKDVQSTFDPSRPEHIYCETCYLNQVY